MSATRSNNDEAPAVDGEALAEPEAAVALPVVSELVAEPVAEAAELV